MPALESYQQLVFTGKNAPLVAGRFSESVQYAIDTGDAFVARRSFSSGSIEAWRRDVVEDVMKREKFFAPAVNAVVGVAFNVAARAIIDERKAVNAAYEMGCVGQRRLTLAFTGLHRTDRITLAQPNRDDVESSIAGALSVARLAAGLTCRKMTCRLPSPDQDRLLAMDLLCESKPGEGACIQVKTGKPEVYQVMSGTTETERRLLRGTAKFNGENRVRWVPLFVGMPNNLLRGRFSTAGMEKFYLSVVTAMKPYGGDSSSRGEAGRST